MYYVAIILVLLWTSMVYGGPMAFVCSPEPCEVVVDDPAVDSRFFDIENRLTALEAGVPPIPSLTWYPIVPGDPLQLTPVLPTARGQLESPVLIITQGVSENLSALVVRVRTDKLMVQGPGLIYVVLRGGPQYITGKITLGVNDSGTSINPIIYTSTPGTWTRFSGNIVLDNTQFSVIQDQDVLNRLHPDVRSVVMEYDLSTLPGFDIGTVTMLAEEGTWPQNTAPNQLTLFYESSRMSLARWPNKGTSEIIGQPHPSIPATFQYMHNRGDNWVGEINLYINGYFHYDYANAYAPVESIDVVGKYIQIKPYLMAPMYHEFGFTPGQPYYVLNVLPELDVPGEWYVDRQTQMLYFYPPSPLTTEEVSLSANANIMIDINNTQWVTFDHVVIEGGRSILMTMDNVQNVNLVNSVIRNGGTKVAVRYNTNSSDSQVMNNEFYNIASSAVHIYHTVGDRITLVSGNLLVSNNLFHHLAQEQVTPGIIFYGVGNTFEHNEVHNIPWNTLQVSGNNNLIQYNRFTDVTLDTGDAGGIYGGRDWTVRGHIVRYNHFQNIGTPNQEVNAVYLDDGLSGWTVFGNIFENGDRGIQLGGGRDHRIENNIFTNNKWDLYLDARYQGSDMVGSTQHTLWLAQPTQTPPWSTQYPELVNIMNESPGSPLNNEVNHNIFLGDGIIQSEGGAQGIISFTGNRDDTDIGYSLVLDAQYQLDAQSLLDFPEWQQIPFSLIGRQ